MKDDKKYDSSLPQSDESLSDDNVAEDKRATSDSRFSTTASVSDSISRIRLQLDKEKVTKPSITLDIDGTDAPITFTNRREIIIGRTDPNSNMHPDIDVSGLPINFSSISRKHLRLLFSNGTWYAEDMGSRNGSWLNGKLLLAHQRYQVRNQDTFQIGTVNFSVTFRDAVQEVQPSHKPTTSIVSQRDTNTLALRTVEVNSQQIGLSPTYISNIVMPYVSTIITMMKSLDRAKKRSVRDISVVSISLQQPHIIVEFSIRHEVLQFLNQHSELKLSQDFDMLDETTQAFEPAQLTVQSDPIALQAVKEFTEKQLPLVTPEKSEQFQREFAQSLDIILNHTLHIVS